MQTLKRAWLHMKEFLFIAMPPLLLVSSVFLGGVLQYTGIIQAFQDIFAPFMETVLGLPPMRQPH